MRTPSLLALAIAVAWSPGTTSARAQEFGHGTSWPHEPPPWESRQPVVPGRTFAGGDNAGLPPHSHGSPHVDPHGFPPPAEFSGTWRTAPPWQRVHTADDGVYCDGFESGECDCHPLDPRHVERDWTWQLLPEGVLFRNYMAGPKESRLGVTWASSTDDEVLMDATLGGHVGVLRYGTVGRIDAEGYQLDFDGAALLRMNWSQNLDVEATDFRYGVPLTWARGPWEWRFGYYHLSSHTGDEYLVRNGTLRRANYIRDSLVFGLAYFVNPDLRVYGEADLAFHTAGGAGSQHYQFGLDYSPAEYNARYGNPFFAINGLLREEVNFGGGLNVVTGWQWRGRDHDRLFRLGLRYYNGESAQYSFFDEHEELIGGGLWYDY